MSVMAPHASPAMSVVPLHALDACASLYDLSTDALQSRLSELVSSVSSGGAAVSLEQFMLVEKQILLIHQELRERHLSVALANDPWMDSELDDVHVGQRERQAEEAAREADEVDRQMEDMRRGGDRQHAAENRVAGSPTAAPMSAAEQHWANRGADRRGLDEARRRKAETGAVRAMSTTGAATTSSRPSPPLPRNKSSSASSSSKSSALSIPASILNQRREMVIMTSSVDNRRMNKSSSSKSSKKEAASVTSPPHSAGSSSNRSTAMKRSASTTRTKPAKPALTAQQRAKQYADAQRRDASAKSASKASTANASAVSTAASTPRDTARSASPASSDPSSQPTPQPRPDSSASTVVGSGSLSSVASPPSPSPAGDTDTPTHTSDIEDLSESVSDDVQQMTLDARPMQTAVTSGEVEEEEIELDDSYQEDASDDDRATIQNASSASLHSQRTTVPPNAYASMDHAAIEAARAGSSPTALVSVLAPGSPILTARIPNTTSDTSAPLAPMHIDGDNDSTSSPSPTHVARAIRVSPSSFASSSPLSSARSSSSVPSDAALDEELEDEDASTQPHHSSEDAVAPSPTSLSAAEWAAAVSAGDSVLEALKRRQQARLVKSGAAHTKSNPAIDQAVQVSRDRVARLNPKKEAERAVARLARTREEQREIVEQEREAKRREREATHAGRNATRRTTTSRDKNALADSATVTPDTPLSSPSAASTVVVVPPKPKRPPKPPLVTAAYESAIPGIEYIFSAMWSASSSGPTTAAGQNWFSALVTHIAQCEKFKMAFGLPSSRRVQRLGSAHARIRIVGANALAADEVRLEYLTGAIQSGGSAAAIAAKQKLGHADNKALEQSRLLKAQRVHQQNLLTATADGRTALPSADADEPEDDETVARDHGPNNNSSALIFLVTHEREEVYTVVRQALLALKDEPQETTSGAIGSEKETEGTPTVVNSLVLPRAQDRVWVECSVEDAPKPDRLFPFLPPNFTSAAIGAAPAHALPPAPTPLWLNPPSASQHNSHNSTSAATSAPAAGSLLAPQAGVEFSSNGGQFHELSSSSLLPGVPSARGTPSLYWNLLWTWKKPHIDYSKLFVWQKVNHFPDSRCLTRKDLLKKQIEKYSQHRGYRHRHEWNIMPQTFLLPQEYQQFIDCFARQAVESQAALQANPNDPPLQSLNYWICKPPSLSRGRGIFVTDSLEEIDYKEPLLIQRYVLNPLLLHGYKFDLRVYVLVTSIQPLEVFLYREGFARISTTKFSTATRDLKNKFIHLTNSSVQKNNILTQDGKEIGGAGAEKTRDKRDPTKVNRTGDARFDQPAGSASMGSAPKQSLTDSIFHDPAGDGGSKISFAYLWHHLRSTGVDTDDLWSKITRVVLKTLVAVEDDITPCVNSFEMFGFDVLISDDLEAHLIEVNASPSMGLETPLDQKLKPRLIRDIVNLVAPMPMHRYFLQHLLERRFQTGHFERGVPKSREKKLQAMNELLHHTLMAAKPRLVGEMPQQMGDFERIAPLTPAYESTMKMKRAAFQPTTNAEHKHKRSLPPIV